MNSNAPDAVVAVTLNGKPENVKVDSTVLDVIQRKNLRPELVAVEYNGEILTREQVNTTWLRQGDQLEIVHFVGGG